MKGNESKVTGGHWCQGCTKAVSDLRSFRTPLTNHFTFYVLHFTGNSRTNYAIPEINIQILHTDRQITQGSLNVVSVPLLGSSTGTANKSKLLRYIQDALMFGCLFWWGKQLHGFLQPSRSLMLFMWPIAVSESGLQNDPCQIRWSFCNKVPSSHFSQHQSNAICSANVC